MLCSWYIKEFCMQYILFLPLKPHEQLAAWEKPKFVILQDLLLYIINFLSICNISTESEVAFLTLPQKYFV